MTTLSLSTDALTLGTLSIGASNSRTVVVSNDSDDDVTITALSAPFSVDTLTVPANSEVTLTVTFTPTATGSFSADLSFSDGSTVPLTGIATAVDVTTAADDDAYTESTFSRDSASCTNLTLEVDDFIGEKETIANFPDYNITLASYLRLGAVPDTYYTTYSGGGDYLGSVGAHGEDLASQVLSFVDDSRDRGDASSPYYRLSEANRKTETAQLHTRGGWRDHTDGNRVTTTRGDKVEVIGGHSKLIVMGRRQWNKDGTYGADDDDASLHWESSGGITYHYDQVPGQIVDVRWIEDPDSVFRVKEECQKGHFVARYSGVAKSWHYGPSVETRIGSKPAYETMVQETDAPTSPAASPESGYTADADFDKAGDDQSVVNREDHGYADVWPPSDATLPTINQTTWANTITIHEWARLAADYTGSKDRPVRKIVEKVYATRIVDKDVAKDVDETTHFVKKFETTIDITDAGRLCTKRYGDYKAMADGFAGETWGVGASGHWRATNFAEVFLGGFESIRLGFSTMSYSGSAINMHLGNVGVLDLFMGVNQVEFQVLAYHHTLNLWGYDAKWQSMKFSARVASNHHLRMNGWYGLANYVGPSALAVVTATTVLAAASTAALIGVGAMIEAFDNN